MKNAMGKHIFIKLAFFISLIIIFTKEVFSYDLGKHGNSFAITEQGFTQVMKERLHEVDITAHQEKIKERAEKQIKEPIKVAGLIKTAKARTFYWDPSYMVPEDIKLANGEILHNAGKIINPLEHFNIEYSLYFINGNDEEQVKWFKDNGREDDHLILVEGRPIELEDKLNRAVYFDQFGELIKKVRIKQVPAVMKQEGLMMRVDEVDIDA